MCRAANEPSQVELLAAQAWLGLICRGVLDLIPHRLPQKLAYELGRPFHLSPFGFELYASTTIVSLLLL